MALILFFLRHGETQASQAGGYCGVLDVEPTPEGPRMAEEFSAVYKSLPWVAVFCSPLRRTMDTIKALCNAVGLKTLLRDSLKEIAYGKWEGKTSEEVNRRFHDEYVRWPADAGWNAPTGGERGVGSPPQLSCAGGDGTEVPIGECPSGIPQCHDPHHDLFPAGNRCGRYRDRISMPGDSLSIVEMTKQGPFLRVLGDRSYFGECLSLRPGT